MYCIEMNRNENEFWESPLVKVVKLIDIYADRKLAESKAIQGEKYKSKYFNAKEQVKTVKSLKDIPGIV